MLAVPLKETKGLDWSGPLRTYLENNYSKEELDKHASSVQRLSTTRERVANSSGAAEASVDALESYLTMLGQVEPRFPLGEGGLKLTFTWYDALKPSKKLGISQVAFERGCVLFNLGAVLSHQGMVQDRSEISGLKKACLFFQRAAGLFHYIKEEMVEGERMLGPTLTDMSPEGLDMLYYLMLAQAQACFYEKAIRDKHKAGILSKLASQAAIWYEKAHDCSESSALSATLDRAWPTHLDFQKHCFQASANFQYSKVIHAKAEETTEGYGEEIARLGLSSQKCETAIHIATTGKLPSSMLDTVTHLRQVIHKTMDEATENNNRIYMQTIPPANSLTIPPSTPLAKALAPSDEWIKPAEISNDDNDNDDDNDGGIFKGLLPVEMQEADTLYQSRLSHLVESNGKKVQDAAEEVKLRLAEAGLPAAVEAGDGSHGLPQAVWNRMQSNVLSRGGIDGLKQGIRENENLVSKIETSLGEIEYKLTTEEKEDTRARTQWGNQWTISSSVELSLHMRGDISRYRQLINEARSSDAVLKEKLENSLAKMEILKYSKDRLDKLFPSSDDVDSNPDVEATRTDLSLMLVQLGANIQECEKYQQQIVDTTTNDSIASAMVKAPGGPKAIAARENGVDSLIEKEVQKYQPYLDEIDRLIKEQPSLLNRVLEKNHKFSMIRNQSEGMLKREGLIAEIDNAISCFDELVVFIAEGEKFYHNLQQRVTQLQTTAQDHCYVREIQRKEMEMDLQARQAQQQQQQQQNNPSSYPGMTRPGINREASTPFMSPYAASDVAQAFPLNQAPVQQPVSTGPAPAYPVSSPPPPSYNAATTNGNAPPSYSSATSSNNNEKLSIMKATLGNDIPDSQLLSALDGAGGDVNVAINHIFENQEKASTPTTKRKSKSKRFGIF